MTIWNICKS